MSEKRAVGQAESETHAQGKAIMNEGGRKQRIKVIIIKKRRSLRGRTRRPLTHAVDWENQK